eukprot:4894421-Karenia_brevis.AAC.1
MKGLPWQPVANKKSNRIPTRIKEEGDGDDEEDEIVDEDEENEFEIQVETGEDEDASRLLKPDLVSKEIKRRAMS